jgi:hypothetical protein
MSTGNPQSQGRKRQVAKSQNNFAVRIAQLTPRMLLLVSAMSLTGSAVLAGLLIWLWSSQSDWIVWFGLTTSIASFVLTIFIFVWTATSTARKPLSVKHEVIEVILGQTNLARRDPTDPELDAIAKARGFGESRDALRAIVRGAWGIPGSGRAARMYLLEGPDILFVRATAARFNPLGPIEATRTPTDRWLK